MSQNGNFHITIPASLRLKVFFAVAVPRLLLPFRYETIKATTMPNAIIKIMTMNAVLLAFALSLVRTHGYNMTHPECECEVCYFDQEVMFPECCRDRCLGARREDCNRFTGCEKGKQALLLLFARSGIKQASFSKSDACKT